ncbi:nuclear transport factor 2 family protein [Halioxenophilus aromaticivorans]|uniref:Nuclear transport factor 2 family protein n=1 Tax=Halioxenophilus aromaticivorans TaxID=1306992 RepID=A0AAV3UA67_9ALTE
MQQSNGSQLSEQELVGLKALVLRNTLYDCQLRFTRGMDRFDEDLFLSAFHSDAVISAGPFVGSPQELYSWAKDLHEQGQKATQHCLLNFNVDAQGDAAHTETYYQFVARNKDDSNWIAGGRYIDKFTRIDGQWRISTRQNIIEWSGLLPSLDIPFGDLPDVNDNGLAMRDKTDISYLRPLINRRQHQIPSD